MCPVIDNNPEGLPNEAEGLPLELHDPDHPGEPTPSKAKRTGERVMTSQEKMLKETDVIPGTMEELKRALEEKIGLGVSFDVVLREMVFGGKKCGIFYLNGFVKDTILTDIITRLSYVDHGRMDVDTLQTLQNKLIAHIQVDKLDKLGSVVDKVLTGMTAVFVEGENGALVIDAKSYPVRSISEPTLERVVRGSRDGLVETLMTSVTLIRRRVRDPRLKFEVMQVGTRSKTDTCLAYINDIADPELVEAVRKKLKKVQVDALPLGEKQLEEALVEKKWNPYPLVRYSERPDVVASHLYEGHVVLLSDTSPSAMILPCTMFQLMQHAEEYRQTPTVGTYLRWVRYFGILSSLFLLPVWYLMVAYPELKPTGLQWLGPAEFGKLPIFMQFLFAELGVDLMRMAALHTPTPLATAMGLIAAILIGDIAVKTGIFVNEVILYMAVATIGMFATPSYELSLANRIVRILLLLAAATLGVPGFVGAATLWMVILTVQRSYNTPYMWPFIPFNAKAMFSMAFRKPFASNKHRPSITKPYDSTRQPT